MKRVPAEETSRGEACGERPRSPRVDGHTLITSPEIQKYQVNLVFSLDRIPFDRAFRFPPDFSAPASLPFPLTFLCIASSCVLHMSLCIYVNVWCLISLLITFHCMPFNCLAIAPLFPLLSPPIHSSSLSPVSIALHVRVREFITLVCLAPFPFLSASPRFPFHAD